MGVEERETYQMEEDSTFVPIHSEVLFVLQGKVA